MTGHGQRNRLRPKGADIVAKVENRTTLKISRKLIFGLLCCCVASQRHWARAVRALLPPDRFLGECCPSCRWILDNNAKNRDGDSVQFNILYCDTVSRDMAATVRQTRDSRLGGQKRRCLNVRF